MDLPCAAWTEHVEKKWNRLDVAEKRGFSTLTDINEMFCFGRSLITAEDGHMFSGVPEGYFVHKGCESAGKFREKGNSCFKSKDYSSAVLQYSRGVCYAPAGSEQLALCYANRSAALFHLCHYKECLEDINRALAHGYPSNLQPKLLSRKTQCLSHLQQQGAVQRKPTTGNRIELNVKDTQQDICLCFSSEKGRHIVATKTKKPGEVVFEDCAFSAVLIPGDGSSPDVNKKNAACTFGSEDRYCHRCLGHTLNPVPCAGCSYARYCGERCREQAWHGHHRWECPLGSELLAMGVLAQLALRVALTAGVENLKRAQDSLKDAPKQICKPKSERVCKTCCSAQTESAAEGTGCDTVKDFDLGCHDNTYTWVYSLLPHVEGHTASLRFLYAITVGMLYQRLQEACPPPPSWTNCVSVSDQHGSQSQCEDETAENMFWPPELSLLGVTALRHLLQLRCNAQAISAERVSDDHKGAVQASRQIRIATVVFPTLSLLNHSCRPNTSLSFSAPSQATASDGGIWVTVRASRAVHTGQELLHCYGPHFSRMKVRDRQRLLLEQYCFQCSCEACLQELQPGAEDPCAYQVSRTEMEHSLQGTRDLLHQAQELIDADRPGQALQYLQQAATKAEHLEDTHHLQGQLFDTTARVYASMGNWHLAATHLSRSVAAIRSQYGEDSVELGQQMFKLVQLYFNGGEAVHALSVIPEARNLLARHCGPRCQELQELRAMEECLQGVL
ncbi:protein-lysine N-methyltransferase SMYD4 isoform X2 [Denticeps clupeoides]|uniref:protein-lysine N-methyltransferase SMYD4 isoform X2 n=1 Tax=Denticeps clupeoides TaxID=299321 RepID=UPI0010A447C1|nr:SET and MYND domain-containing protein 4 isoform X2 [Denticeps clupeoides]